MSAKAPWAGIVKLQEEMAELGVELAKLHAYPSGNHPDVRDGKRPLLERLLDELGDVQAALRFFIEVNGINEETIDTRREFKENLFWQWHERDGMTGTKPE